MDMKEIFLNVRGIERILKIATPTRPQIIMHVACWVRTFIAIVKVRICDAIQNIM